MDAAGWEASTDPEAMLEALYHLRRAGGRRVRLFAAACCRRIWHLLADPRSRAAVEALERSAEGLLVNDIWGLLGAAHAACDDESVAAPSACSAAHAAAALVTAPAGSSLEFDTVVSVVPEAQDAARVAVADSYGPDSMAAQRRESAAEADLLRDIFGPITPATFDPSWRTEAAVALATRMYGTRDFSLMPILADALADAGCPDGDILEHCRGGPHVRGCWVIDLLLTKE